MQRALGLGLETFRELVQDISQLVEPVALLGRLGPHVPDGAPEPQGPIANRDHGHLEPAALQPSQQAAETREQAEEHLDTFVAEYEAKYPKAAACLATDREALLTFFAFPAEHWIHLRTTNVIESPFATVRLRQRGTKGAGSRTKGLLMAYKLLDMAQRRWRRLKVLQSPVPRARPH